MAHEFSAVVIGASAGALDALSTILMRLPPDYPVPIIIVVHVPPDKPSILAQLLSAKSALDVQEAEDKEILKNGTVYVAPPNYHLQIEPNKQLSLSGDDEVLYSRPSIDVLFETAADAYGSCVIGVVLTGANSDGANGLKAIIGSGGIGLVQSPDTAYATAMPEAALKTNPTAKSLSLEQIADYLVKAILV